MPAIAGTQIGLPYGGAPPGGAPAHVGGPISRTRRDLAILAVVVVVLGGLVRVGSRVEHAVPVSVGTTPITNTDEVVAAAEARFQEMVEAQATRVSADAACYFFRPLGPTQGAMPAGMFPSGLLPGGEDAEGLDVLLCGPVEMATEAMDAVPGSQPQPWLSGIVYYFPADSGTALRGEFKMMLQSSLAVLTVATGGVKRDQLVKANGHHPDAGILDDPDWRDVTPTGELPPGGPGFPGGELPPDLSVPELPPDLSVPELPPDMSIPELPPGMTLPPDISLPDLPRRSPAVPVRT